MLQHENGFNTIYARIHDEHFLEESLQCYKDRPQEREDFEKGAIKYLFLTPEELREHMGMCNINRNVRSQLYLALKEHVRRQRGLQTLDFKFEVLVSIN
ncbi:MAG: hypothetical protein AABX33_03060 [Nanoarchaeota archaeon]